MRLISYYIYVIILDGPETIWDNCAHLLPAPRFFRMGYERCITPVIFEGKHDDL